jgi:hypothetical protein
MALKGIINLLQKARAGMQKFSAYPEQQSGLDEIDNISKKVLKDTNPETKTPLQTQSKQTQALTVLDANQQAEIALIDKNKDLQKAVINKPLSMGDDYFKQKGLTPPEYRLSPGNKDFASSLYDVIASDQQMKKMPASYWMDILKPSRFKGTYDKPGIQKVVKTVTKEELNDTNLVRLDADNNPVGGLLYLAAKMNQKVGKDTLLKFVESNPANMYQFKKFAYDKDIVGEVDALVGFTKNIQTKINEGLNNKTIKFKKGLKETQATFNLKADNHIKDLNHRKVQLQTAIQTGSTKYDRRGNRPYGSYITALGSFSDNIYNLFDQKSLSDPIKQMLKTQQRAVNLTDESLLWGKNKQVPIYGSDWAYRIPGSDEYIEEIAFIKPNQKFDTKIMSKHFGLQDNSVHPDVGYPEGFPNVGGHVRYSIRPMHSVKNPSTPATDASTKKIAVIDEIQSDVSVAMGERILANPNMLKGTSPYGKREIAALLGEAQDDLYQGTKKLNDFITNPANFDNLDAGKLENELIDLRTKMSALEDEQKVIAAGPDEVGQFLPFASGARKDRELYTDFFIKRAIKSAQKDPNVEWVGISPTTRTQAAKLDRTIDARGKLGNWEVYGSPSGKMGIEGVKGMKKKPGGGYEVVPTDSKSRTISRRILDNLAKQYDSEVRQVNVAKSDPEKPWKLTKRFDTETSRLLKLNRTTGEDLEVYYAFKTKEEAQAAMEHMATTDRPLSGLKVEKIDKSDPLNYFETYAIKLTPSMRDYAFKTYKKEGGLVVDLFKW